MRFRERTRQAPNHSVEKHKPVSGGQPFFITNSFHDNRKYFHGESAAYECQHEPTTTGSALGGATLTSTCTARAVFASPASFRAASWRIRIDEHGVAAPPDVRCVSRPLTVRRKPGHPTVTGRAHVAASYSVSSGTSGQQSHTSLSCAPSSSKFPAPLFPTFLQDVRRLLFHAWRRRGR